MNSSVTKCEECGSPKGRRKRYCSSECRKSAGRTDYTCLECGVTFNGTKSPVRLYCSRECSLSSLAKRNRRSVTLTCSWCSREFESKPHKKRKYCSKTCAVAYGRTKITPSCRRSLKGLYKRVSCTCCSTEVKVYKSTANARVLCKKHRAERTFWLTRARCFRERNRTEPATVPYSYYTIVSMGASSGPITVTLAHNMSRKSKDIVLPLSQYIVETRLRRFLHESESVVFLDGNSQNLSPNNLSAEFNVEVPRPRFSHL